MKCLHCDKDLILSNKGSQPRFCATSCKNKYYSSRRSSHRRQQFEAQPIDINVHNEIMNAVRERKKSK